MRAKSLSQRRHNITKQAKNETSLEKMDVMYGNEAIVRMYGETIKYTRVRTGCVTEKVTENMSGRLFSRIVLFLGIQSIY